MPAKSTPPVQSIRLSITTIAVSAALVACTASLALAGTIEQIRKRGFLYVCASPMAMPFSSGPSPEEGFGVDLAGALARQLGVDVKFSWVQYRFEARFTDCDAFMGVGVLPGDKSPLKKTEPILQVESLLVTRPDRDVGSLDDLDGLRVALQSGSLAHVKLLERSVDIRVSYTSDDRVLNAVLEGEVDAGVVTSVGLGWFLARNPGSALKYKLASFLQTPTGYPMAIGLRKTSDETLRLFNEALAELNKTGEMTRLKAKYGLDIRIE